MTIDQDNFTVALHDLADRDPVTAAPTEQVLRRARRAHRGRTAAVTAGALAVATIAGGLAVGLVRGEPAATTTATGTATAVPADTPALQLVAAVQASARTSFRFSVTFGGRSVEFGEEKAFRQRTYAGAYDPRVPKGYSTAAGAAMGQRLIGKDYYREKAGTWFKFPAGPEVSLIDDVDDIGLLNPLATVDFLEQLDTLRTAGTVSRTSPTSYTFGFTWEPGDPDRPATVPVTGTIQVDPKTRLVTAMSYDYVLAYPDGDADAKFFQSVRWTYSGYGLPVDVDVPPKVTNLVPGK